MSNTIKFLLERNLVVVPPSVTPALLRELRTDFEESSPMAPKAMLGTVIANIIHYGYVPSASLYQNLTDLDAKSLINFWNTLKPAFESVTGADKKMDQHIVYKNFPQEVLDMSEGEYWIKQILMYWGLPNELFTQKEEPRDSLLENTELAVLQAASDDSLQIQYDQLLALPVKWTRTQMGYACSLLDDVTLDLAKIPFKENLVYAAVEAVKVNAQLTTRSAMDVLRLAVALSDGDYTLKENSKFTSFSRSTRRFLLGLLENASNLEEDMARDTGKWKKFMVALRPGDYASRFPNVVNAYSKLYNDKVQSFNASVEVLIASGDEKVLTLLESRPGDFARRLQVLIQLFGRKAINRFVRVAPKLKVIQLLKLRRYFDTVQNRSYRTIAPKGNWGKLKILPNEINIKPTLFKSIVKIIDMVVKDKVFTKIQSVNLDPRVANVAIQGNDSELTSYGRNTKFLIPAEMTFIRTASYWKFPTGGFGDVWFDNGFNFFDADWNDLGSCCWNSAPAGNGYAVFSGDPTNSKTIDGEACQMIDIYLDKAVKAGVRYAVWNILCYSHKSFDEADEVHAALQWGEKPQSGKTFEPSRCQLSFAVTGQNHTKYIAIIDVIDRTVIYIDANLRGQVCSAASNTKSLEETMPAYMEYLETQPTIMDLFRGILQADDGIPILYDDKDVDIQTKLAYVFKPLNENNEFTQLDVSELLTL